MPTTLILLRHGEIVRPVGTSNFDRAPLSERGQKQIEALALAADRGRVCLERIGDEHEVRTVAVSGHGTLFSVVLARLKGERPTEAYKNSVGFAHAAIVGAGSGLRIVRDFRAYGDLGP